MSEFRIYNLLFGICLAFSFSSLGFITLVPPDAAHASVIIQRPLYIGLTNGLVGSWSFDGQDMANATVALDKSGNNNHGTLTSGPTRTAGKIGQALEFDGVNDNVTTADDDIFSFTNGSGQDLPYSISTWVYLRDITSTQGIVSKWVLLGHVEFVLYIDSNTLFIENYDSPCCGGLIGRSAALNSSHLNKWHHLVATYTGSETGSGFALFLDGVRIDTSTTDFDDYEGISNGGFGVEIGSYENSKNFFDGLIDDVRIYNRALSPTEIKRLHKIGGTLTVNKAAYTGSLANGLVGAWTFDGDEVSTNSTQMKVTDVSGNSNYGSADTTARPSRVIGRLGQALTFDGSNDVVAIPDSASLDIANNITVSAWVNKTTSVPDDFPALVAKSISGENVGYNINYDSTAANVRFFIGNGNFGEYDLVSTTAPSTNAWHHIVGVADASRVRIYIDGVEQNSVARTIGTIANTSSSLCIGSYSVVPDNCFLDFISASIDDVLIYNRALSAAEIKRLHRIGGTLTINAPVYEGLTNGLIGSWTFDGPDMNATQALDTSGQGNHGTLSGGPTRAIGRLGQALSFDGVDDGISGGSTASAPTFVQEAELDGFIFDWDSSTPKSTPSFNVLAGDVLVAFAMTSGWGSGDDLNISGGSLSWTERQAVQVTDYSAVHIWTATVDSNKSMTVTVTASGASRDFGGNVLTFRNSDGVGASSKTNVSSGAPTLNLTTTEANSAIVVANGDWNAVDGASRTWRTNAGTLTEQSYHFESGQYTAYGGYHADAGAVGTYVVGLSAPSGQKYSIAAVEVKGESTASGLNVGNTQTVSFWVKPNSTTQSILDMNGTQSISLSSGTLTATNFTSPTIYVDGVQTSTFPDTNWHHVAVTTNAAVNASSFIIGAISTSYFNGLIDDVRLYDKVLTPKEIQRLYQQ